MTEMMKDSDNRTTRTIKPKGLGKKLANHVLTRDSYLEYIKKPYD